MAENRSIIDLLKNAGAWISVILAIAAFASGIYQYGHTKKQEFRKAFWEKQYSLYSDVTKLAAQIAIADDLKDVASERKRFWELYWGPMSMVENKEVFDAMVSYGEDLYNQEVLGHTASGLRQLSYTLARACRRSLKQTWEPVFIDDIPEAKIWSKDAYSKK